MDQNQVTLLDSPKCTEYAVGCPRSEVVHSEPLASLVEIQVLVDRILVLGQLGVVLQVLLTGCT